MYYHQFNFNDFIGFTRFLKNDEIAIFIKLQVQYLQDEKPLKNNMAFLSRLFGASDDDTLNILEMFYELKDGSWCRDQLDQIIAEYKSNLDANSRGGKKSAEIRRLKSLETNSTSTNLEVTNNHKQINHKLQPNKTITTEREINKPYDVDMSVWEDYLELRKDKNSPLTKPILNSIMREAEVADMTLNTALMYCIENGWIGFKSEWVEDRFPNPFEKESV
jgi:uncharacterized protein YdaU (DUF1376 family)